jgi:hypothetical protein
MATQQDLLTGWREYFDEALRNIGIRAPLPSLNQSSNDYAREVCRSLKHRYLPQNHPLYGVQFRGLKADALQQFAPQLVEAVKVEAINPNNFPGEIRPLERLDPHTGQVRMRDWVGSQSFVADPAYGFRPGRRVLGFRTPTDDRGQSINWNRVP